MIRDPAILLLAFGQTLAWSSAYYVFPALLLQWEAALGWSRADLTAAISVAILTSAIGAPIAGRLIDRGLGRWLMTGSTAAAGVGLLLLSQVVTLWQFYLVWVFIGATLSGCLYEPCFAIVTRARGAAAKQAIILITLIAGFAGTISFPLTFSLAEAFGWRATVSIYGVLMMTGIAPLMFAGVRKLEAAMERPPTDAKATTTREYQFLRRSAFWFLAGGMTCLALLHGATLHHLLPILATAGASAEIAVFAASFIGPMQVAGRLAMMASEKHVSLQSVAQVAFLLMGVSVLLLMFSGGSPLMLVGFVILFGGAYGTVSIIRPVIARDILGGEGFGAKSGALALPFLAGSAAAPFAGSLIWGIGGYDLMLPLLAGLSVLAVLGYRMAMRSVG